MALPIPIPIAGGISGVNELGLAVSHNCVNKIASIVYHAGILPTSIEGDLIPADTAPGCLGALLALFSRASTYTYHADLKQPSFNFSGNGQITIMGGADVSILANGTPQASISFDFALPGIVSLVAPGSHPTQPDQPQIKLEVGHPQVTSHVTGLPSSLEWVLNQLGDAVGAFFVDHVCQIPAFPAFFDDQGYGVVLRDLEVTPDQLIVRADLAWPGRIPPGPLPIPPIGRADVASSGTIPPGPLPIPPVHPAVGTEVPFTLRPPLRHDIPQPAATSNVPAISASVASGNYRTLPPITRPGNVTWPIQGPDYDFAVALNQKPVQDVLNEKFPISFSASLPDPINRVDFTINASFLLMDSATDKIQLGANIMGSNSSAAEIHCTGEANFSLQVALLRSTDGVKGQVAALGVNVTGADCHEATPVGGGIGVDATPLANWLANEVNLQDAVNQKLQERFGEPLIPLTFPLFQGTIGSLTVSVQLSNVVIVGYELQVWITINEAASLQWHWQLGQPPRLG